MIFKNGLLDVPKPTKMIWCVLTLIHYYYAVRLQFHIITDECRLVSYNLKVLFLYFQISFRTVPVFYGHELNPLE